MCIYYSECGTIVLDWFSSPLTSMTKTSYIPKHLKAPEPVFSELKNVCKNFNNKEIAFLVHLYVSEIIERKKERTEYPYVAIPYTTINNGLRTGRVNIESLAFAGFLEMKEDQYGNTYSKSLNLCRRFRLTPKTRNHILQGYENTDIDTPWVNIETGKEIKTRNTNKEKALREGNTAPSETVFKGIYPIKKCVWNKKLVEKHIEKLRLAAEKEKAIGLKVTEQARYIGDLTIYKNLLSHSTILDKTFAVYKPMFETQMSGRVTELGGGLQNCSRRMKAAAMDGVKNVHNYDLKSSQVYILKAKFEEAGISTAEVCKLLTEDKKEIATRIGLPVDVVKEMKISLLMGARLEPLNKVNKRNPGSIYESILKNAKNFEYSYNKFYDRYKALKKDIDDWHDYIVVEAQNNMNRKKFVSNKCGAKFNLGEFLNENGKVKNLKTLKRRLAAFHLQGEEANFIHTLSSLSSKYGYEVYSNQHDGLITENEIPQQAIDEAISLTGFEYAQLVEKPLCEDYEPIHKPKVRKRKLDPERTGEEEIDLSEFIETPMDELTEQDILELAILNGGQDYEEDFEEVEQFLPDREKTSQEVPDLFWDIL